MIKLKQTIIKNIDRPIINSTDQVRYNRDTKMLMLVKGDYCRVTVK